MAHRSPSLALDERLFSPGQRLAVAVSGGADSVALLRALVDRREALGLVLSVVHVNHGIRGQEWNYEADRDEAFVKALAAEHNLPLHLTHVDTPAYASAQGQSLEEAARTLRYKFFRERLAADTIDAIATAHTLDDQAETVLHKLLRGAWTEGLGGISPQLDRTILRPLLHTTCAEIEAYLRALNQPWCEDSTNADPAHTRNRIRHRLLPMLRDYNPRIATQLSRLATIARDEEAWWQQEVARIAPSLVLPGRPVRGGGRSSSTHPEQAMIAFEMERLRPLAPALQRRLLRWAGRQLHANIDFEHIELLMRMITVKAQAGGASRRVDLGGGLYAQRTLREMQFVRDSRVNADQPGEYLLSIPGSLSLPALGLAFIAKAPVAVGSALIRHPRPGDRVTPRFTRGSKTIKEVLERQQFSSSDRDGVWLVVWPAPPEKGQIVWLQGVELEAAAMAALPFQLEVVPIRP